MQLQDKIIKDLAVSLNKDPEVIQRVCTSIFELLTETMREGKYEPYRIQGLGLFEVKPYIRQKSEKSKLKKQQELINKELFK